ncbi:Carbohydrate-selective porin OprB [Stanieria sp. NIES-3757]|nr:Carbohydrate-selective porin OprB [Stanieria sp. NIES-3757]
MNKLFWNLLKVTPALIGASLFTANSTLAQTVNGTADSVGNTLEQIDRYNEQNSNQPMSQVTNVNQLRDVSPTDWAYEALRSLVDRYGCIAGYPNQTYRGNQALSRYEFAAGLNSCLNQIERLIASSESVLREDLDTINRLTQEFEAELATLGGRVDDLESRTAFLEDHQFSTTTKLKGEAIFAVVDTFGEGDDSQVTLSDRVRLNFDTSFTGKDRLRTRLQAGNVPDLADVTGTDMARLGFDANNDNNIEIDELYYTSSIGDNVNFYVGAAGLDFDDIFDVTNPVLESSGTGALSRFNRYNPLVFRSTQGAGLGATVGLGETLEFTAAYLVDSGVSDPSEGEGLFNGSYSAGGQIKFTPIENLDIAATYVHGFQTEDSVNLSGSTGSEIAADPFDDGNAVAADRFGLGATYQIGSKFNVAAFGGYAMSQDLVTENEADLWTWGANIALLDFGKEGAELVVGGGMPPKVSDGDGITEDPDTSYLIEALYKFPVNDNILLTPGAYVILNPDHNDNNDTTWVGVLRTTFQF